MSQKYEVVTGGPLQGQLVFELNRRNGLSVPFSLQVENDIKGALNCFIGEIMELSKCEQHIKKVYGV